MKNTTKLPFLTDADLTGWWYLEYTGDLSLEAFLADYHSKMERRDTRDDQ